MPAKSIAIVGPTACGKTHRAVAVANYFNGEIISADSRQVYSGMSIGTGKDIDEYGSVKYHLIDVARAGDKYNLHRYLKDFRIAYDDILSRGKMPVICGGSGMYVENALSGISLPDVPENKELRAKLEKLSLGTLAKMLASMKRLHNVTDIDTVKRAVRALEIEYYYREHPEEAAKAETANVEPLDALIVGVDIPREKRRECISARLAHRLENGMLEEVRSLLDSGLSPEDLIYYGLEYKYLTMHITGKLSYDEMVHNLEIAIHQFAKRQMTWFRGMESRGYHINWIPFDIPDGQFVAKISDLLRTQ
ncbi:MAG: tRNA (adenosine(37)-N6)-dimethylallyltransferase MiaA [Candidatus Amulumruptor caecigallinarius]|nr:tRNA (adenosine(37)-N6)-dimethylallyltransferase MiaA [Candidatus Amulumruptor caecigallinarius]